MPWPRGRDPRTEGIRMSVVHHPVRPGRSIGSPIVEDLPLGVLVADRRGRVSAVNRAWSRLSGLGPAASMGHGWLRCLPPKDRRRILREMAHQDSGPHSHPVDHELWVDGERRWTRWWFAVRPDVSPVVTMTVADVHEDHVLRDELQHRAFHDPLTGLVNRSHLFELTERALRGHRRDRSLLAVLYIDLDDFKEINDRFGHAAGDRVLVAVAAALQEAVRPQDVLARVGGDEFAIVCDHLRDPADAAAVVERVREVLRVPIDVGGVHRVVSASVGLALAGDETDSPAFLLDRADQAMYRCKAGAVPPGRA